MTRTHRVLSGFMTGYAHLVLATIAGLWLTPFFLHALGQGTPFSAAAGEGKPLAEGAATAPALVARAARHDVELPIAEAVADVLKGALDVKGAVDRLLSRPLRPE